MRRIALIAAFLMATALPARADKDCKRMQVQVTALQGQIADMQRKAADSVSELQRLTQLVAEQNALLKAALDAGRQQDEAVLATMDDLGGRVSEVMERLEALRVAGNRHEMFDRIADRREAQYRRRRADLDDLPELFDVAGRRRRNQDLP